MSGSRDRRREQRRRRKLRTAERQAEMAARSEARNEEARDALEPLPQGERPRVVTVGAAVSGFVAAIFTVSAAVAGAGSITVSGSHPRPFPLAISAVVLWAMAWGMWKARYWAVLGFEMLLVLFMLSAAAGLLLGASSALQLIATSALLIGLGALFYYLIKAMARIEMPRPPGSPGG